VRPVVDDGGEIEIKDGRHPVVEANLPRGEFIPNDLSLDAEENITDAEKEESFSFALITGPNMAGKSTYLRQAALITIMAQSGSFVPASEARIGLVDRVFCRVGAQDNLARGESTFLVEMNETAFILHSATNRSLVIMDEVGRGTGTEDGLSIAWAVCEELLERTRCRTLFATHYHELSKIKHGCMVNRSMDVDERNGEIVFLRKLKDGPAGKSYGLHVASLAGLPDQVIRRAEELMGSLSEQKPLAPSEIPGAAARPSIQSSAAKNDAAVIKALSELDINIITPLEALNLIQQWKKIILDKKKPSRAKITGNGPLLFDL
jgi:DNA mismatch repair protein MutS